MSSLGAGLAAPTPMAAPGLDLLDPVWLLDQLGPTLFWAGLLIIFVECGLLFPFLPGDALLFAMGIFIATGEVDLFPGTRLAELGIAMTLMVAAAWLGNVTGFEIGRRVGPSLRERDGPLLRRQHFDKTELFFDRHGNSALVLGRFVAFVRTYITVVAGITAMARRRFYTWSLVGGVCWVLLVTSLGYFLGDTVPWLENNIDLIFATILAFTIVPIAFEWWRKRRAPELAGDPVGVAAGVAVSPPRDARAGSSGPG